MTSRTKGVLPLLVYVLLFSCSSGRKEAGKADRGTDDRIEQEIRKRTSLRILWERGLGADEVLYNGSKSFALCMSRSKPTTELPQQQISFLIYDLSTRSVIFGDEVSNGSVMWKNDHQVQVNIIPGIIPGDETLAKKQIGYIFDVRTKKKLDLESIDTLKLE